MSLLLEQNQILDNFDWEKAYQKMWRQIWPYHLIPRWTNYCDCGQEECGHALDWSDIWEPSEYLTCLSFLRQVKKRVDGKGVVEREYLFKNPWQNHRKYRGLEGGGERRG